MPKVSFDDALYEELQAIAEEKGYASTAEFVVHVMEQIASAAGEDQDEDVLTRLRGLGYIA